MESFAYVELARSGQLSRRAAEAYELLGPRCVVCPRGCKVDRRADVPGLCAIGRHAVVASHFPHFGEEDCLRGRRGSGTIFFSGCNLRCVFCLTPDALVATGRGPRRISEIYSAAVDEVQVGDGHARRPVDTHVVTVTGDLAQASKVFRHQYSGDIVRLKPFSAPEVWLTPNHEVFAAHGSAPGRLVKVAAGSLTAEHLVVVPKPTTSATLSQIDVADVLSAHVSEPIWTSARAVNEVAPLLASGQPSSRVAAALGYHPSYVRTLRSRMRRGLRPPAGPRIREVRTEDMGDHFLVPLREIERKPYDGDVYNLEVDDESHSFVAGAIAIANCQNHDISWQVRGEHAPPERLAGMMLELQAIGCHNVNWVTPEHVVPQILEALPLAVEAGLRLPIVYNTSAYDSLDSLRLMDGVVDVYMPDFKLWTSESARRYLKRADYADVARETIKEMHRQVGDLVVDERGMARRGLILRHLVMPGLLDETEEILRWVAAELGTSCYVNLMAQYYVSGNVGKDGKYEEIARGIHREEYERALAVARELGLRLDTRSVGERDRLARAS